jgi:hypothetical protein
MANLLGSYFGDPFGLHLNWSFYLKKWENIDHPNEGGQFYLPCGAVEIMMDKTISELVEY